MMWCIIYSLIWRHDISHIQDHKVSQPFVQNVDTAANGEEEEARLLKEVEASSKSGRYCSYHLEAVATL